MGAVSKQAVEKAVSGKGVVLSDLYRDPSGIIMLDVAAPVLEEEYGLLGVLILRSDANSFLYPLIQSWPVPTKTAENLLVKQEGDGVICLNDLRYSAGAALSLRLPLSGETLPFVEAVLGKRGEFEGRDYRLRLQSRQITDEKALKAFQESQTRIRAMAMIHEKLYQSKDFAGIDFADYIDKMVTHLFVVCEVDPKRVHFRNEVRAVILDINRAIPCALIVNELVSNALKYAFPEEKAGELTVGMFKDETEKYHLAVKDTGIGMPKKIDAHRPQTLGLQIVNDLTKQIEGTLELYRDGGTEFEITF